MNPASKELLMGLLTRLVAIMIAAKALALALLWLLPGEGVDMTRSASVQPAYHRYGLDAMLSAGPAAEGPAATTAAAHTRITDLILKGLYGKERKGFVIIALKTQPEATEVVTIGEAFHGYTLISIHPQSALFEYRGTEYSVMIDTAEIAAEPFEAPAADTGAAEAPAQVSREQINSYTKDLNRVWQDIGIREVKNGQKIEGFRVIRIRPGSPFADLGLQRGDVIVKANNKQLDSYAAAMEVYEQIDRLQALELIILRNNQEKELVYEIH